MSDQGYTRIDLPADKFLRLECLKLADRDHVVTHDDPRTPASDVVERARAYAAFVLTEERGAPGVSESSHG